MEHPSQWTLPQLLAPLHPTPEGFQRTVQQVRSK